MTTKIIYGVILTLLVFITQPACTCDNPSVSNENYNNKESENMGAVNINLREFDEKENKMMIDVILDKVKDYPGICTPDIFVFKAESKDFILVSTSASDTTENYTITAYYRLKDNTSEKDDAMVKMTFCTSKEESHKRIKYFLDGYTMVEVYASNLKVGDLALGGIHRVDFVRGNVYMFVEGLDGVEIDTLAQEIDRQILEIINKE